MSQFKRYTPILSLIILLLITAGCASTGNANESSDQNRFDNPDFTLGDYLREVPGINIEGGGVTIRNTTSFNADTRALFVVDGQKLGRNYRHLNLRSKDIKSVKVLKGSEASIYGVEGANGVIEITTKGN